MFTGGQLTTRSKTAADYATIAVAPILIFVMISCLANFLMLIVYRGNYSTRVAWTLLMYTMGAVSVARIAIEQNRNVSIGYAVILALAAFAVMSGLISGSPIFCAGILAIIAYLSDRIVHDCTLIDDDVDASGQGLIDFGSSALREQIAAAKESTATKQGDDAPLTDSKPKRSEHQPGRTVMYLALGALPLFGIGQFFIRSDTATWASAQRFLALYLFSSLSLLVTTSFLGLRRYLRQRRVEMPADVSFAWIAGGLALIALILTVAYMAPMPGQALASFELPAYLKSPEGRTASEQGWGDEAADKTSQGAKTTPNDKQEDGKEIEDIRAQEGAKPGDSGDGKGKQGPTGKQSGGKKNPGKDAGKDPGGKEQNAKQPGPKGQQQSGKQQPGNKSKAPKSSQDGQKSSQEKSSTQSKQADQAKKSDQAPPSKNDDAAKPNDPAKGDASKDNQDREQPNAKTRSDAKQDRDQDPDRQSADEEASAGKQESDASNDQQQPSASSSAPPTKSSDKPSASGPSAVGKMVSSIAGFFKYVIMLALLIVVGVFVYLHRHALVAWFNSLFDREPLDGDLAADQPLDAEPADPSRPFSSYRNPVGNEHDPRRVIVITFQAFEAWMREQGWSRLKNETPSEFLRRIVRAAPDTAVTQATTPARQIVEAYNRIVYGQGQATNQDMRAAQQVWQAMTS